MAKLQSHRLHDASGDDQSRLGWLLTTCVLVALPYAVVSYPPVIDLPQQVAQIRLFEELSAATASRYEVYWTIPNRLSYFLMLALRQVASYESLGRLTMVLLALAWVVAAFGLARAFKRPAAAAILASGLTFSHVFYWGFLNFVSGWPVFALWLCLLERRRNRPLSVNAWLGLSAVALGLYLAHIFWLGLGLAIWAAYQWRTTTSRSAQMVEALALLPASALAVFWSTFLTEAFNARTSWLDWRSFSLDWLPLMTYGGLKGWTETILILVVITWLAVGWHRGRGLEWRGAEPKLLLPGLFLFAFAWAAPFSFRGTVEFGTRWAPVAVTLIILGAPRILAPRRLLAAGALTILAGHVAVTASTWRAFERVELAGLDRALAALPGRVRVLGLDYVRESRFLPRQPFFQVVAQAQVEKGADLGMSFAKFRSSLIQFRDPSKPWTDGLEWRPEQLDPAADLPYFDYVLVNGRDHALAFFDDLAWLEPASAGRPWRLYRIDHAMLAMKQATMDCGQGLTFHPGPKWRCSFGAVDVGSKDRAIGRPEGARKMTR